MDEKLIEEMARAMFRASSITTHLWKDCDEDIRESYRICARDCAPFAFKAGLEKAAELLEEIESEFVDIGQRWAIYRAKTAIRAKAYDAAAIRKAGEATAPEPQT